MDKNILLLFGHKYVFLFFRCVPNKVPVPFVSKTHFVFYHVNQNETLPVVIHDVVPEKGLHWLPNKLKMRSSFGNGVVLQIPVQDILRDNFLVK